MLLGSFLPHEKFISLLSILSHHPFGATRSHPLPGGLLGSVWTAIPSPVNLPPGKLFPLIFFMVLNHVLLCGDGFFPSLYHPFKKSQPFDTLRLPV
jgi:hypothetical protein